MKPIYLPDPRVFPEVKKLSRIGRRTFWDIFGSWAIIGVMIYVSYRLFPPLESPLNVLVYFACLRFGRAASR
jgi:uncharacterized membrane protein YhaH (DUF805 family)